MSKRSARLAHNDRQNCEALFAEGVNQIIFRTLVADTQTPVGMMMKLSEKQTYHCLLAVSYTHLTLPTTDRV